MRKLIGVAVVSAVVGAASALWAESIIVGTNVRSSNIAPASARILPHEIMKETKGLTAQVVEGMI